MEGQQNTLFRLSKIIFDDYNPCHKSKKDIDKGFILYYTLNIKILENKNLQKPKQFISGGKYGI